MISVEQKNQIKRLLYLRRELGNVIENAITEYVLREKPLDVNNLKDSLLYRIDDCIEALKQGR